MHIVEEAQSFLLVKAFLCFFIKKLTYFWLKDEKSAFILQILSSDWLMLLALLASDWPSICSFSWRLPATVAATRQNRLVFPPLIELDDFPPALT